MENSKEVTSVRQNSMYTSSLKHETNLRRNTTLHFQIGLILALLTSIFGIEMRSQEHAIALVDRPESIDQVFTIDQVQVEKPKVLVREKVKVKVPKVEEPKILDSIQEKNDDDLKVFEDDLTPSDPTNDPLVDPNTTEYDDEVFDEDPHWC